MTDNCRIGCVKYLNARPLINGWPGPVEFDHPSVLCRKLAGGELDVALVSSFEYLRRPKYSVVDGVCVASNGPVYSVFVAHDEELSAVREIAIDPASETSVMLLRCLLRSRGWSPQLSTQPTPGGAAARLLIGDQAIRFRRSNPQHRYWDLGKEWRERTGLPFVFALWLIRKNVNNAAEIAAQLRALRDSNVAGMEEIIAAEHEFEREFVRRYFFENLHFTLGDNERSALRAFHQHCLFSGIEVAPEFEMKLV